MWTDAAERFSVHQWHTAPRLRLVHMYTAWRCGTAEDDCYAPRCCRFLVTSPSVRVQSIVISVSVCLSVCLSARVSQQCIHTQQLASDSATWRSITSSLILPHWRHYVKNGIIHKPEVHNDDSILHCCMRTERRQEITYTENFVKFGHVVWDMQTDRHTYRQTYLAPFLEEK